MACKCEEIRKCEDDKEKLEKALGLLARIIEENGAIQGQLQSLMGSSSEAYTTENIEEICTAIDKLNDDIEPAAGGLISEISIKQDELDVMLAEFIDEDKRYHTGEERAE